MSHNASKLGASNARLVPSEYNALRAIYDSTNGPNWVWNSNYEIYGFPWDFSNSTMKNPCAESWQGLRCYLFQCSTEGCNLFYMNLTTMNMSGTLPSFESKFPKLASLVIAENDIRGAIPSLRGMPDIQILNFSYNSFTSSIPDTFQDMSQLYLLYLSNNHLTGTLPPSIYNLTLLQYLNVYNNHLHGTLSTQISQLTALNYVNLANNHFGATLPPQLFALPLLARVFFHSNHFHGSLPEYLGTHLEVLRTSECQLVGRLPESICNNTGLQILSLFQNHHTGLLPSCLSAMQHLQVLQLQENRFSGDLAPVFNSTLQKNLEIVDLSSNAFVGQFPPELLRLPRLISVAAGKNCFHGSIPSCVCEPDEDAIPSKGEDVSPPRLGVSVGRNLSIIALDGLAASEHCVVPFWDPFGMADAEFGGIMQGSIPECIWSLPRLSILHLSGNGLTGSLPAFPQCTSRSEGDEQSSTLSADTPCGLSPALQDVMLSHNRLTGTIPTVFQHFRFTSLDLAYNKLHGHIEQMDGVNISTSPSNSDRVLHLTANRLTGLVPESYQYAYNIDILRGNLFACRSDGHSPAEHDPSSTTAGCGSQALDGSLYWLYIFVAAIIGTLLLVLAGFYCVRKQRARLAKAYRALRYTHVYGEQVKDIPVPLTSVDPPCNGSDEAVNPLSSSTSASALDLAPETNPSLLASAAWEGAPTQGASTSYPSTLPLEGVSRPYQSPLPRGSSVKPVLGDASLPASLPKPPTSLYFPPPAIGGPLERREEGTRAVWARNYYNLTQYLASLIFVRRLSVLVGGYSLIVCMPTYVVLYKWGDGSNYSTHDDRYSWITTVAFLSGPLPAGVLMLQWTILLVLVLHTVVWQYNLHIPPARGNSDGVVTHVIRLFSEASVKMRESVRGSLTQRGSLLSPLLRRNRASRASYQPVDGNDLDDVDPKERGSLESDRLAAMNMVLSQSAREERSAKSGKERRTMESNTVVLSPFAAIPYEVLSAPALSEMVSDGQGAGHVGDEEAKTGDACADLLTNRPEGSSRPSPFPSLRSSPVDASLPAATTRNTLESASEPSTHTSLSSSAKSIPSLPPITAECASSKPRYLRTRYLCIFLLNVLVTLGMNALYLVAQNTADITSATKMTVQLLMAAFKLLWNIFALRLLMAHLPARRTTVLLHVGMLVFNSLLAPCVATALTDPACFQSCFLSSDSISVSYPLASCIESYQEYDFDTDTITTICTHTVHTTYTTNFTPTMVYYYTCGSKLITLYTPVFIYIYTMLLFGLPIAYFLLAALPSAYDSAKPSKFAVWIRKYVSPLLDGVLRPQERGRVAFHKVLRPYASQAMLVHHVFVMLTFGMASPPLAGLMAVVLAVDTFMWQVILTRYLTFDRSSSPFHPCYCCEHSSSPFHFSDAEKSDGDSLRGAHYATDDDAWKTLPSKPEPKAVHPMACFGARPSSHAMDYSYNSSGGLELGDGGKRSHCMLCSLFSFSDKRKTCLDAEAAGLSRESGSGISSEEEDDYQCEVEKLSELHTVCGESWKTSRRALWLALACALLFYVCLLMDMVGDTQGWKAAIWLPVAGAGGMLLMRAVGVDCLRWMYNQIGGYSYRDIQNEQGEVVEAGES